MSIKEELIDGKKRYLVYVNQRSKLNPKIRAQRKRYTKTKEQAIKVESVLKEEVYRSIFTQEGRGRIFSEVIEEWYTFHTFSKESNLGRESREDYYNALHTWYGHLLNEPVENITKADIKHVIRKAQKMQKSRSFQGKLKNIVSTVFKWAIEEGVITNVLASPTTGISMTKQAEKKPEILSVDEARRFLAIAKHTEHPWYETWATAILTGCRSGELYALTWDDISFESDKIVVSKSYNIRSKEIKSTKAGYYRTVPINADLKSILINLKQGKQKDSKYVLPRFSAWTKGYQAKILRGFLEQHGFPSIKFHTLRACFATMLLEKKVPPATVMKVCGWKDLDTMARYIRLSGIDEEGATDNLNLLPSDKLGNLLTLASKDKNEA